MVTPRKLFDARIWTALMSLLGQLSIKEEPCVEKRIVIPELPGCMAYGSSQEIARRNAQAAVELWLETAREFGDPIPTPRGRRLVFG
jgi:hypothetical protein